MRVIGWVEWATLALVVATSGCALEAQTDEPDGPEPNEEIGIVQSGLSVSQALSSGCSTSTVSGLSKQIIEQMNCIKPNALKEVPSRPNLVKNSTHVFMFMQPPAADALVKALDANPGKTLHISSMLRTLPQQWLLWHWYQAGKCGIPLAATPGNSNHEGGTALDTGDYSSWKSALTAKGFSWYGSSDVYHYTYVGGGTVNLKGQDVLAFQKLWNLNHPEDKIGEDGDFGPQTDARLGKSPAEGFPKGPNCTSEPADGDQDGVADGKDNCPKDKNADQVDTDGDGKGDVCDDDDDGDSVADAEDNCPLDANADQADSDGDGEGDVCDPTPNGAGGASGAGGSAGSPWGTGGVGIGGAAAGTGGEAGSGTKQQSTTLSDSDGSCSISNRRSEVGLAGWLLALGLVALGRRKRAAR